MPRPNVMPAAGTGTRLSLLLGFPVVVVRCGKKNLPMPDCTELAVLVVALVASSAGLAAWASDADLDSCNRFFLGVFAGGTVAAAAVFFSGPFPAHCRLALALALAPALPAAQPRHPLPAAVSVPPQFASRSSSVPCCLAPAILAAHHCHTQPVAASVLLSFVSWSLYPSHFCLVLLHFAPWPEYLLLPALSLLFPRLASLSAW